MVHQPPNILFYAEKNWSSTKFLKKFQKIFLFFHFPAFWTLFGLFFSLTTTKMGFNPARYVQKK